MIDDYYEFRQKRKWGLARPEESEDVQPPKIDRKALYELISQERFLKTLKCPERPESPSSLKFVADESPNFYTLWYACQIMKAVPNYLLATPGGQETFPHYPI